jgi:hypothetical protein
VLGVQRFGSASLGDFFRDSVEYPFFLHHLKGSPDPKLPEALVFDTGNCRDNRHRLSGRHDVHLSLGRAGVARGGLDVALSEGQPRSRTRVGDLPHRARVNPH